jgi:hypothetical protein
MCLSNMSMLICLLIPLIVLLLLILVLAEREHKGVVATENPDLASIHTRKLIFK